MFTNIWRKMYELVEVWKHLIQEVEQDKAESK